jgi:hypothetical protein
MWVWIREDLALFHPVTASRASDRRFYSDLWEPSRSDQALHEEHEVQAAQASSTRREPSESDPVAAAELEDIRHPHAHLQ